MTISGIGELPLFKRRNSGAEEFEALLDLLPHPTLIAEARSGRVLLANAQVAQLTAFTRRELSELDIPTLLPELAGKNLRLLEKKEPQTQKLVMRSSRQTTVTVKVDSLGGQDHWVAVSLLPPQVEKQDPQILEKQRWEALHMLSLVTQQEDLRAAYRQVLQAGRLLTGVPHLALYIGNGDELVLTQSQGDGFAFPEQLPSSDLGHLRQPSIWQPGKPLASQLHKNAHTAKYSYLASTPLDVTRPEAGLVVAASPEGMPANDILTLLQILAATAETARLQDEIVATLKTQTLELNGTRSTSLALQEQIQDGILFADEKLAVVEINPAAEAMLGYTTGEVESRPANDILVSNQSLVPAMELAIAEKKAIDIGERKLHRRDGSEFLASLRVAAIQTGKEAPTVVVFFTDLSEHEAFYLQSQKLEQRAFLGELMAYFAHETRNPINNISTGLQLMQISLPEQDPMQEQISRLLQDCDRLDHRMNSVLTLSRNLDLNPKPMDIGEFCRGQLDRWRPRMARKNIEDHLQIAEGVQHVLGDQRALDQVFTNLITNAIQALEGQEDGIIAINVRHDPKDSHMVSIHISDNGPGIPEELLERIFEPFFTTKQKEGTGLGLPISRRIIRMHKGELSAESYPGGTLFKMTLPATAEEEPSA